MTEPGWYFECVHCLVRGRVYAASREAAGKRKHACADGRRGECRITGPIRPGAHYGHGRERRVCKMVRLDPELAGRLEEAADDRDVSQSWLMRHALIDFLDRLETGPIKLTREVSR